MIGDVISCILIQILSFYLDFYQAELQCHMVQMLFRIVPRYFADNIMRRYRSSERLAYGFRDGVQLRSVFAARDMSLKERSSTNTFLIHLSE